MVTQFGEVGGEESHSLLVTQITVGIFDAFVSFALSSLMWANCLHYNFAVKSYSLKSGEKERNLDRKRTFWFEEMCKKRGSDIYEI